MDSLILSVPCVDLSLEMTLLEGVLDTDRLVEASLPLRSVKITSPF